MRTGICGVGVVLLLEGYCLGLNSRWNLVFPAPFLTSKAGTSSQSLLHNIVMNLLLLKITFPLSREEESEWIVGGRNKKGEEEIRRKCV